MQSRFTSTPSGWDPPSDGRLDFAVARVWEALKHKDAADRMANYYGRGGNYAGATFLDLDPVDPYAWTTGDLLSLTLLGVTAHPVAVRRLLEPSRERGLLLRLLSEEYLPLDADLSMADSGQLLAMKDLYLAVKRALPPAHVANPNPWVTASKLCARKRADLFPIRDNVVCRYLGLIAPKGDYQVDWQVFRHVIQDNSIRRRIDELVDEASRRPGVDIGHPNRRLRHLDVLLWMHARKASVDPEVAESMLVSE